ncbi:MAG: Crp/Fnr family transcriptional regulator [Candidatus Poribacteria bacterium]
MNQKACMANLWLFSSLSFEEKQKLRALAHKRVYEKGEFIFWEGEPCEGVFLLTIGRAKLFKLSEAGKEVILGFLCPNELFGEESLFGEHTHSLSAEAVERCFVCFCAKEDFEELIRQDSTVALKVIKLLGHKINRLTAQTADMALRKVQERVAKTLLRLGEAYGEKTEEGLRLNFRLTHADLAALVGASRVMVSNVIGSLREANALLLDQEGRILVKIEQLAQFMETATEEKLKAPWGEEKFTPFPPQPKVQWNEPPGCQECPAARKWKSGR